MSHVSQKVVLGVVWVMDGLKTSNVEGTVISGNLLLRINGPVDRSGFCVMRYNSLLVSRYLKSSRMVILLIDWLNGLYFCKISRFHVVPLPEPSFLMTY